MNGTVKGSTVLVTGGAGLIGSHIVDQLVACGAGEIRILDNLVRGRRENLARALRHPNVVFVEGDVRDRATVRRTMKDCDYVFHQAAIRITLCAERPRECLEIMVNGTFNVLEAAAALGIRKVVYASSASIYGDAEVYPTAEKHHPYNNRTIYGAAKLMNEAAARSFYSMYGLASVGLRYFNVYGPRMDVTGAYTEVFVRWLDCIDAGIRPQIHGDGSATMDFVYVEDVARANILAAQSDRSDDVYNVASGRETSLIELWNAMQRVTGEHDLTPEFLPPRLVNGVRRRLADVSRARNEIGFEPMYSLDQGLRRLVDWRRSIIDGAARSSSAEALLR